MTTDVRLVTTQEFLQMLVQPIFPDGERLELLEGVIYSMSPVGPYHSVVVSRLITLMSRLIPAGYLINAQSPIALDDSSVPQPDVMITSDTIELAQHLPTPTDVPLVVEVADSTVSKDRRVKSLLYATNQIQEYWLVDLTQGMIEQYTEPGEQGYRTIHRYYPGDTITSTVLPQVFLDVTLLLKK